MVENVIQIKNGIMANVDMSVNIKESDVFSCVQKRLCFES